VDVGLGNESISIFLVLLTLATKYQKGTSSSRTDKTLGDLGGHHTGG